MNTIAAKTLGVTIDMVIPCCSPIALGMLKVWLDRGARPRPIARVWMVGCRLMAVIDFEKPVAAAGSACDGVSLPLIVTLYDGTAGEAMFARVQAADRIVDMLRELPEARP